MRQFPEFATLTTATVAPLCLVNLCHASCVLPEMWRRDGPQTWRVELHSGADGSSKAVIVWSASAVAINVLGQVSVLLRRAVLPAIRRRELSPAFRARILDETNHRVASSARHQRRAERRE